MRKILTAIILSLIFFTPEGAAHLDLTWDANTEPDLAGYRIYYGTASREYLNSIDVGNTTTYRLDGLLERVMYYIAVTAYDTTGNESGFSDEVSSDTGGPTNTPPVADAGPDQTVTLPDNSVFLDATVTDDGLPDLPGAVSTSWSQVSGPGTVDFDDASAVDTTASFSEAGTYVFRLTADDGELNATDEVTILVNEPEGEVVTGRRKGSMILSFSPSHEPKFAVFGYLLTSQ